MTTPGSDPSAVVPPDPVITPDEAAAQEAAAAEAAARAALNNQIRDLATEIAKQTLTSFDPATIRKGTVASIQSTTAPPTLTITISGDTTEIPGVRYLDSYAPVAGDVVLVVKQGTDLFALGQIAGQFSASLWTAATLAAGFTHNGNENGSLMYRRVWDNGSWKMQWKGGVSRSSGTLIIDGLPAEFRPAARRTVTAARSATGGATSVKIDFNTDGSVYMVGGAITMDTVTSGATDPGDTASGGSHVHAVNITDNGHNHSLSMDLTAVTIIGNTGGTSQTHWHTQGGTNTTGQNQSHTHAVNITDNGHNHGMDMGLTAVTIIDDTNSAGAHTHTMGTHTHTVAATVTDPPWIAFNQIEYFLD